MKELRLKIKRENYNLFKELTDKQAGELIKGMCAYMYDCMGEIGAIIGGMLSAAEVMDKDTNDGK